MPRLRKQRRPRLLPLRLSKNLWKRPKWTQNLLQKKSRMKKPEKLPKRPKKKKTLKTKNVKLRTKWPVLSKAPLPVKPRDKPDSRELPMPPRRLRQKEPNKPTMMPK